MSISLREETINHYMEAKAKGSTGALNSMFEVSLRTVLAKSENVRCRLFVEKVGKADIRLGRSTWVEIKTCCSETGSIQNPYEEIDRAHYILYTPELPSAEKIINDCEFCLENTLVFTPNEFKEMLEYIHKDGKSGPHLKSNSNGRMNIQTLKSFSKATGKWSMKPLEKFWRYVDENNIPYASLEWADSVRQ